MKNYQVSLWLSLLCAFGPIFSTFAQNQPVDQEVSTWFLEERFLIADRNDDALLDKSEMLQFPNEFAYYLTDRHFQLADRNQDGFMSFNEIYVRRNTENTYLYNIQRRDLREIARNYPLLAQADLKYLKKNPELVARLFANLIWMYENPDMAEKIYKDKIWMTNHSGVVLALHRNLRWLAANPSEAKLLYRDRTATQELPELLAWRADHKELIRKHPQTTQLYELEFIPEGIRINR